MPDDLHNEHNQHPDEAQAESPTHVSDQDPAPPASNQKAKILDWGPGNPHKNRQLVERWTPSTTSWGAYHRAIFPSREPVTPWIRFKLMSSGVNIARRLWDERESLRLEYEAVHGGDSQDWPVSHPGVVLESVKWVAHPACLGCQWFHRGVSMHDHDWRERAAEQALRHQDSDGRDRPDGHRR